MISGTVLPSAAETSFTVAPDAIATGPVGGGAGAVVAAGLGAGSGPRPRASGRGRFAWESMTTRRRRLPPGAPPLGLSGLLRSAIV